MLEAELFDKLDGVARAVRGCDQPFGGIQVILVGDFFQLPPVSVSQGGCFLFAARCWAALVKHTVVLGVIYRQSDAGVRCSLDSNWMWAQACV